MSEIKLTPWERDFVRKWRRLKKEVAAKARSGQASPGDGMRLVVDIYAADDALTGETVHAEDL